MQPNIIIVSNRLPVSVKRTENGLEFYPSVGGLATGLSSYVTNSKNVWIGWPGIPNEELTEADKQAITEELKKYHCYPVFLSQKQLEQYYNGYSNSILWPLFHDLEVKATQEKAWWSAYQRVNGLFADTVAALARPDSTIWVHDYQLMLVPTLLRAQRPAAHIGFFSHIPFPAHTKFTSLPEARAIVRGMLGADLVGFHTTSYANEFLAAAQDLDIGLVGDGQIVLTGRTVKISDFPMGIDYPKFAQASQTKAVRVERRRLHRQYRKRKVILTVDRLDPSKGLLARLKAYRELLAKNPQLHGKVVMVMLAMPTRTEIPEYKKLKGDLEKLVKQVNDRFGSAKWQPIDYMYTSVPFETLSALYQVADVAFIAPLRDGMNLVAKEYVASKSDKQGVLILSATAGAAEELADALIVDPGQPATYVAALQNALTMPKRELKQRITNMQEQLSVFTVEEWAGSFMRSLHQPVPGAQRITRTSILNKKRASGLLRDFRKAQKRLLLLDYDGVLVPISAKPEDAAPTDQIYKLIQQLAANSANEVVILSGRPRDDLQSWFGDLPIALAAEHGALFRRKGGKAWHKTRPLDDSWKASIAPILEKYAAQTPGAFVEDKKWSLVWHYRQSPPYYAQKNLVIIKRLLKRWLKKYNLSAMDGRKVLEIVQNDINKGRVAQEWLIPEYDFILALGDDLTDEDTFAVLPPTAYGIKVGRGRTVARYRLNSQREAFSLLRDLVR